MVSRVYLLGWSVAFQQSLGAFSCVFRFLAASKPIQRGHHCSGGRRARELARHVQYGITPSQSGSCPHAFYFERSRGKIQGVLSDFLAASDAERATAVMRKLQRHGTLEWALTGGLAVEIHAIRCGLPTPRRTLNDIDFVVPRFDCIQESIGSNFLCRHIHPLDPPGRTIAQTGR